MEIEWTLKVDSFEKQQRRPNWGAFLTFNSNYPLAGE